MCKRDIMMLRLAASATCPQPTAGCRSDSAVTIRYRSRRCADEVYHEAGSAGLDEVGNQRLRGIELSRDAQGGTAALPSSIKNGRGRLLQSCRPSDVNAGCGEVRVHDIPLVQHLDKRNSVGPLSASMATNSRGACVCTLGYHLKNKDVSYTRDDMLLVSSRIVYV
jgi:hypothetical protein